MFLETETFPGYRISVGGFYNCDTPFFVKERNGKETI